MFENCGQACSKQQKYIGDLYNGKINLNIDRFNLDIGLIDENIYVEYDGSGHKLSMKFNDMTQSEFDRVEELRYYFLRNRGWKMMRIVSLNDYIPNDSTLLYMLEISRQWLVAHSWIIFDIDKNLYKNSEGEFMFDYGILKKFPKKRKKIQK